VRSGGAKGHMPNLRGLVVNPGEIEFIDEDEVSIDVAIGRSSTRHHVKMALPIFVTEMDYGIVSKSARLALVGGASLAGTAIAAGHGGTLFEEKEVLEEKGGSLLVKWSKGRHGIDTHQLNYGSAVVIDMTRRVGRVVPGPAVTTEVAQAYEVERGIDITEPPFHLDMETDADLQGHVDLIREVTDHEIPIISKFDSGDAYNKTKLAIGAGVDAVWFEGMEAWRPFNPEPEADNVGTPTLGIFGPANQAFTELKAREKGIKLLVSGGILDGADVFKAMALGADAVGIGTAARLAIGCNLADKCAEGKCPEGICTMDPRVETKLNWKAASRSLENLLISMGDEVGRLCAIAGYKSVKDLDIEAVRALSYDVASMTGAKLVGYDKQLPIWVR